MEQIKIWTKREVIKDMPKIQKGPKKYKMGDLSKGVANTF